jgi:hypothetical protein
LDEPELINPLQSTKENIMADVVVLNGVAKNNGAPIRASITAKSITNPARYALAAVCDVSGAYRFTNLGTCGVWSITAAADGLATQVKEITIKSQGRLTSVVCNFDL